MSKLTPIRDPVHNYIYITSIEQPIIDTPEFQRLRFILQNSSAYLTYPSNNNSRFLHSLGVMHLAGELFLNAINNASSSTASAFLLHIREYVTKYGIEPNITRLLQDWKETIGESAHFTHQHLAGSLSYDEQRMLVNLIWQSVRLAALMHDIGHFPFSHVFEFAFKKFLSFESEASEHAQFKHDLNKRLDSFRKGIHRHFEDEIFPSDPLPNRDLNSYLLRDYDLHELWGAIIFSTKHSEKLSAFCDTVFHIAKIIAFAKPKKDLPLPEDHLHPFRCLHGLISGELDADRLDYCLRDPMSSGLEFRAIDVTRITRSMHLIGDGVKTPYTILPEARALSALESFFHQRYLTYQYLIYHHNVARLDGVIEAIITRFFEHAASKEQFAELLDKFGFWDRRPRAGNYHFLDKGGFERYDDAWLRTLMSECLVELKALKVEGRTTAELEQVEILLDTFLYRKTENIVSMWKREADYQHTIDDLYSALMKVDEYIVIRELETNAYELYERIKKYLLDEIRTGLSPVTDGGPHLKEFLKNLKPDLEALGVVPIFRHLKPKVPVKDRLRVLVDETPRNIWEVSSYLKSLGTKEMAPTIFIAFVARELKERGSKKDTEGKS